MFPPRLPQKYRTCPSEVTIKNAVLRLLSREEEAAVMIHKTFCNACAGILVREHMKLMEEIQKDGIPAHCPTYQEFSDFANSKVAGVVDVSKEAWITHHLANCAECKSQQMPERLLKEFAKEVRNRSSSSN